jgi:hypothetical protein
MQRAAEKRAKTAKTGNDPHRESEAQVALALVERLRSAHGHELARIRLALVLLAAEHGAVRRRRSNS